MIRFCWLEGGFITNSWPIQAWYMDLDPKDELFYDSNGKKKVDL